MGSRSLDLCLCQPFKHFRCPVICCQAAKRWGFSSIKFLLVYLLLTRFTLACKKCSVEIVEQAFESFWQPMLIFQWYFSWNICYSGDRFAVDPAIPWLHRWMSYSHVTDERGGFLTHLLECCFIWSTCLHTWVERCLCILRLGSLVRLQLVRLLKAVNLSWDLPFVDQHL